MEGSGGTKLASESSGGTVTLWDTETGERLEILEGHTDSVESVAWSPDGTKLATGSVEGTIVLWDVGD
jgi:WD40 repeat protein